jgi:hypothetical protein
VTAETDVTGAEADVAGAGASLRERVASWLARSCAARRDVRSALASGTIPQELTARLEALHSEEEALLVEALPYARERLLPTRDLKGRVEVLLADVSKLGESGLPDAVVSLAREQLSEQDELPEPELPEGLELDADADGWELAGQRLVGMPFCSAGDAETIFLFTDEGACYLLEHNLSWQVAPAPLATEAFVTRLARESSSSCLFVDVDQRLYRVSYNRLDTPEKLLREEIYG